MPDCIVPAMLSWLHFGHFNDGAL
ncbi:hypothetical protein [Duncaniella muris]